MFKYVFGFVYCNLNIIDRVYIIILFDEILDIVEKLNRFCGFILGIENIFVYWGRGIYFL